ncbi:hypothetical protein O181_026351 [Austropuccinia psidii MF-1]|uniref:Uncharacterized protein n=1 Tax=Austropuccinia psidii MF-1 TaxID=1389203 RepID=A0A9Q3CQ95_9BASI|nr:hypothetical protein [Austropuccinia psidii MF-1]
MFSLVLRPWAVGPIRPKGAKGGNPVAPAPQVSPPEPVFGQKLKRPKMTQNPKALKLAHGSTTLNLSISGHSTKDPKQGLWKAPEAPATFNEGISSQDLGKPRPNSMDTSLQESSVVHIRYYIPLFPIFPQTFNGDGSRN